MLVDLLLIDDSHAPTYIVTLMIDKESIPYIILLACEVHQP